MSQTDHVIEQLVALSRLYGSDPSFVLAGGGNTSAKIGDRLFVKGSGHALATISADGFVEMDRAALRALLDRQLGPDRTEREEQFKQAVLAARLHPDRGQRPSVEALLHELMPRTFVVHTHSTLANMVTCCRDGERIARELFGDELLWIPEVDPGFVLAQELRTRLTEFKRATGRDCPRLVLMQNHGLVVAGNTPEEVRGHTDWLIGKLRSRLDEVQGRPAFGTSRPSLASETTRRWVNLVAPALRGLLATSATLKIVCFNDSPAVAELVRGQDGRDIALAGPLTPDQIVYCRSFPLWFTPPADVDEPGLVSSLREAIAVHRQQHASDPQVVLVEDVGLFAVGDDLKSARTAADIYADIVQVTAGAQRLGGVRQMDPSMRTFIEEWEVESYRKQVAAAGQARGRVAGKVAVVTGAAQGFGFEIAEDFARQGGYVVLADINADGVKAAADRINQSLGQSRCVGLPMNVTSPQSVADALHAAVRCFGGFDVFISNAGVLKAGSVKTQPLKDFEFVTSVNYTGYFVCVQQAAPILATQRRAKPDYFSDIIQINSKSGLQGSNRNGAYAGSKFGGIGLTQSFALELVEDGIKVNAICPGNFFDGPLWSDPHHGLFAQYLRTNKVPGAKTIEDVKRAYESKVPMGRGCRTADVVKAIYYLVEQEYETGQAVPVTGGQVMLG